jgi:hypothetical protein
MSFFMDVAPQAALWSCCPGDVGIPVLPGQSRWVKSMRRHLELTPVGNFPEVIAAAEQADEHEEPHSRSVPDSERDRQSAAARVMKDVARLPITWPSDAAPPSSRRA